jgi:hypothetical protein
MNQDTTRGIPDPPMPTAPNPRSDAPMPWVASRGFYVSGGPHTLDDFTYDQPTEPPVIAKEPEKPFNADAHRKFMRGLA